MSSVDTSGGDVLTNAQLVLSNLRAENKLLRRKTLNGILEEIKSLENNFDKKCALAIPKPHRQAIKLDSDDEEPAEDSSSRDLQTACDIAIISVYGSVSNLIKSLILSISDPVEKCRELAFQSLTLLVTKSSPKTTRHSLPIIIPALVNRLAQPELIEPSEEVRLLGISFISSLIQACSKELSSFIDDLISVVTCTLIDPYHEVRILSCQVTSQLARTMPEVFHYSSERLQKPLCSSLTHQQSRVRKSTVLCIGDTLQFGNHKPCEEYIPYLITRLFDSNPTVRKATVQIVGEWMMNFSDRYSHFHRFLPIILTGLCDESPEVQELAENLWARVGDRYLDENAEEYKDFIDFPAPPPAHYPPGINRPNFGCRILTHREICKLIPGVTHDIMDWQETNREKSAQLLYYLILNCEEKTTMHVEPLFQCMFRACLDANQVVIKYVLQSATLLGYFVPLETCWPLLEENIRSNPSEGCLAVASSYLKGVNPEYLQNFLDKILTLLGAPEINRTLHAGRLNWILTGMETVLALCPKQIAQDWGEQTFQVLVVVIAMSVDEEVISRAQKAIEVLKQFCGLDSVDDLFGLYCGELLEEIKEAQVEWTMTTPERLIFTTILTQGGSGIEKNINIVLDILVEYLGAKRDPEVRLGLFTELTEILRNYAEVEGGNKEKIEFFVKTIIEDVLNKSLVWRAGRSAAALRTAALNCLLTILIGRLIHPRTVEELVEGIGTCCMGLLDDQYYLNRLFSAKCIGELASICGRNMHVMLINKVYPELLKRLDDETKEVRIGATQAVSEIFNNLPDDYTVDLFRVYFEHVAGVLLVHLDDRDEDVQNAVSDTLLIVGNTCPKAVLAKCEDFKGKHRTPDRCNAIIAKLNSN